MNIDSVVIRTVDEADAVAQEAERCPEIYDLGDPQPVSLYPDRSYEDGIIMFWDWLVGNSDEHPYPEALK